MSEGGLHPPVTFNGHEGSGHEWKLAFEYCTARPHGR
jgi:hypothetical protein